MKVILDTNVFVSGIFFSGPPHQILQAWRDGSLKLILSQEILEEYQRVAETLAAQFSGINIDPLLELVTINAELFPSTSLPEPVCDDPDDDKFLACALVSRCKIIVSGDKHLLRVGL